MSELYLSRVAVDLRSRPVRRDLADCYEMHRTVMSLFGQLPRRDRDGRVLYRVETDRRAGVHPTLLIQSPAPPGWVELPEGYLLSADGNPASKRIDGALSLLEAGTTLRFRLRANPTRKIRVAGGENGNAPQRPARVDLRGHDHLMGWIQRKAQQGGFDLLQVEVEDNRPPLPDVRWQTADLVRGARRTNGSVARLTFAAVTFDGHLRVRDPANLTETIRCGIGSAKGFGFGLLSIARPEAL
jgi:CRISPR system Cascade subunit CasE